MKRQSHAFTLVELLVVIVIIAVLVGILLPVIFRAKEQGRCAKCQSNLKQIYFAALRYANEKGGLPSSVSTEYQDPVSGAWKRLSTGWVDWFNYPANPRTYWAGNNAIPCITNGSLFVYVTDPRLYLCPSFARKDVCGRDDAKRGYVMNSQMSGGSITMRGATHTMLFADGGIHRFERPGGPQTADAGLRGWDAVNWNSTFYEANDRTIGGATGRRRYYHLDAEIYGVVGLSPPYPNEAIGSYHGGRGNGVFVDGHVEKLHPTNTLSVCSGNWGNF